MSSRRVQPRGSGPSQRRHSRHPGGGRQDGAARQAGLHRQVLQEGLRHAQSVQRKPRLGRRLLALPHLRLPEGQPAENPVQHQLHYEVDAGSGFSMVPRL